jgi:hypothetical protein
VPGDGSTLRPPPNDHHADDQSCPDDQGSQDAESEGIEQGVDDQPYQFNQQIVGSCRIFEHVHCGCCLSLLPTNKSHATDKNHISPAARVESEGLEVESRVSMEAAAGLLKGLLARGTLKIAPGKFPIHQTAQRKWISSAAALN